MSLCIAVSVCLCVCAFAGEPAKFVRGPTFMKNALSDLRFRFSMPVCLMLQVSLSV